MFLLAWGPWGGCSKCPRTDEVKRKRKRKCLNVCKQTEEKNEKCPPFHNMMRNIKLTDTDTTECSPCPDLGVYLHARSKKS